VQLAPRVPWDLVSQSGGPEWEERARLVYSLVQPFFYDGRKRGRGGERSGARQPIFGRSGDFSNEWGIVPSKFREVQKAAEEVEVNFNTTLSSPILACAHYSLTADRP
jgi:hypothetical protein